MYIRGGYNVYPAEVEAVLETHEAVVSAAVVAYADPVLGERGRAFLVTRGGACDADEVRKHCRDHLADYKIPDDVRFVDELPLIGPRQGRSSGTCGAGRNAMSTRPPQDPPARAIDIHVHPADAQSQEDLFGRELAEHFYRHFRTDVPKLPMEELAEHYRELDMVAVLLALDVETATGRRGNTNDSVAAMVRQFPDTFAGFASVDPPRASRRCSSSSARSASSGSAA